MYERNTLASVLKTIDQMHHKAENAFYSIIRHHLYLQQLIVNRPIN